MADDTQLFINNWSTSISDATVAVDATTINIPGADSALLGAIAANEYFVATCSDGSNLEIVWVTANDEVGALTVVRAKEGTTGLSYSSGDTIEIRNTKGSYQNFVQRDAAETLTQKTLTSPVLNTGVSGTGVINDDSMSTASETTVATSESIKAYVDASGASRVDTSGTPVANDMARFTDADTIEGRSYAEVKGDLDLEIGTDVLAQQTIGIANDNLLEVDGTPLDTEVAVFTAAGINGLSTSEMKSLLTYLQAGDANNMADALLTRPEIKDYSETVKVLTIATNTLTLNLEDASVFTWTATDNATTFAITNWLASKSKSLTLFFIQAAVAKTIDWTDESIIWAGGTAPDITTINSKHVICISSPDGGTTKYGFHASSEAA